MGIFNKPYRQPSGTGAASIAATLTASPTGSDVTFAYQWQKNGVDIGGETTSTLSVDPVEAATYDVDITVTNTRTAGTDPVVRTYTASSTWTKPTASNFKELLAIVVSAGGGGGSGRRGAALSGRSGGGGGQGGALIMRRYAASELASGSHDVTVGLGGTGGAGQTTNTNNGNNGSVGGTSSFSTGGSLISVTGGDFGEGGTTSSGTAGSGNHTFSPSDYLPTAIGAAGRTGGTTAPTTPSRSGNVAAMLTDRVALAGAAGGGGGGVNTGDTESAGGPGGGVYSYTTLTAGPTGGAIKTAGTNGTNDVGVKIFGDNAFAIGFGTGGSGAGGENGVAGSGTATNAGGNGGRAAGGGGGGGNTNDLAWTDFDGGDGGDGFVILIEYYGA